MQLQLKQYCVIKHYSAQKYVNLYISGYVLWMSDGLDVYPNKFSLVVEAICKNMIKIRLIGLRYLGPENVNLLENNFYILQKV